MVVPPSDQAPYEATSDARFGPYIVEALIGARPTVELARATFFGGRNRSQSVALRRTRRLHDGGHDRLLRAASAYAMLRHPDVVPVIDFGSFEGRTYVVTPIERGYSLREVLQRAGGLETGFPTDVALFIANTALGALDYAHRHRHPQVHGDLCHTNVLISVDGDVRLADFGLGLSSTRDRSPRGLNVTPGHGLIAYLAPELIRGAAPTPATDVFGIGILLYELLVGRWLFCAPHEAPIVDALSSGRYEVPIERYRPDLHPALTRLVLKALAPDPRHRFRDARTFRDAIDALVCQVGVNLSRTFVQSLMGALF